MQNKPDAGLLPTSCVPFEVQRKTGLLCKEEAGFQRVEKVFLSRWLSGFLNVEGTLCPLYAEGKLPEAQKRLARAIPPAPARSCGKGV